MLYRARTQKKYPIATRRRGSCSTPPAWGEMARNAPIRHAVRLSEPPFNYGRGETGGRAYGET